MYLNDDQYNLKKESINRLEYLVNCFVDLLVSPDIDTEVICRLDELSTGIMNCISEIGEGEVFDYLSEEIMTHITECIRESGSEEYAMYKIDQLISIYDDESD